MHDTFYSAAMNPQLQVDVDVQDMDGLPSLLDMTRTNDEYDAWLEGDIDYLVPDFGDFEQLFYTIG
jgi:hypothetical protein